MNMNDEKKRCQEQYQKYVVPKLSEQDIGKFVALDIDSGEFDIDPDDCRAAMTLRKRLPNARLWLLKAGQFATYHIR